MLSQQAGDRDAVDMSMIISAKLNIAVITGRKSEASLLKDMKPMAYKSYQGVCCITEEGLQLIWTLCFIKKNIGFIRESKVTYAKIVRGTFSCLEIVRLQMTVGTIQTASAFRHRNTVQSYASQVCSEVGLGPRWPK